MAHADVCMMRAQCSGVFWQVPASWMAPPGKKPDFNIRMSGFPEDDARCVCASSAPCDCLSSKAMTCAVALKLAICCAALKWRALSPWMLHPKVYPSMNDSIAAFLQG